ncbi:MAG: MFS transporter [Halothiobacillaceae bacterium]
MSLGLPRTVIVLGLVSMLNDSASEMIAPLLPIFLTATLGVGPAIVGLIEGVAEATASLLKLVSGRLMDRGWSAKRLVLGGYGVSNLARPLIGLALGWGWVLLLRFLDRLGKGLRTAPRDALIAGAVEERQRGWAFGVHRAFDHAGAVIGPLLAFALLSMGVALGDVFLWSVIPGVLVVLLLVFGLPPQAPATLTGTPVAPLRWSLLDARLRGLILATAAMALVAVPEAFLVLWAHDRGLDVVWLPLLWAAASGVKMLIVAPLAALSDRFGRVPMLAWGWSLRCAVLVVLAFNGLDTSWLVTFGLFLAYAAALASTEGAERALIGDRAPVEVRGTAFGLYHMVSGLAALPGALLFGVIWQMAGSQIAFAVAAMVSALALLAFLRMVTKA